MFDHDLHVHTYLSACCADKANQQPARILAVAERLGRKTIGFSDHLWMNPDVAPSEWYRPQDERQIVRLRDDLRSVSFPVRVLIGCEADTVAPGRFSITRAFAQTLDYVGLSCSHFHMKGFVEQPRDTTPRALGEHMLMFFRSAVESGLATTIVHPLKPIGFDSIYEQAMATLSDAMLSDAFRMAAQLGVALEITPSFLPPGGVAPSPLWSLDTPRRMLALARAAGCRFTLGSDAHTLKGMDQLNKLEGLLAPLKLTAADFAPITRHGNDAGVKHA